MHLSLLPLLLPVLSSLVRAQGSTGITFKTINSTGTGCPQGSVMYNAIYSYNAKENVSNLRTDLEGFHLYYGPTVPIKDTIKDCTIYFDIRFTEPGRKLWVNHNGMDVRAYSPMDVGMYITIRSWYQWEGVAEQKTNSLTVNGPIKDIFYQHSNNATDNEAPSPCEGGILKVKYDARIKSTKPWPGGVPDPEPDLDNWTFLTGMQLGAC